MHSIITFILFIQFHFSSLFVYYYHCHYYHYYYYFLFFIFILFIHLSNRKLLKLFRLQNVHTTPSLNDGIVQLAPSWGVQANRGMNYPYALDPLENNHHR